MEKPDGEARNADVTSKDVSKINRVHSPTADSHLQSKLMQKT